MLHHIIYSVVHIVSFSDFLSGLEENSLHGVFDVKTFDFFAKIICDDCINAFLFPILEKLTEKLDKDSPKLTLCHVEGFLYHHTLPILSS